MPWPGNARMQLTATGLSWSCSPLVMFSSGAIAPRTTSLAGALWTPRVASLRAQMPATCPVGGTIVGRPVTGSITLIHGQYAVGVDDALVEGGHQVRHAQHGDLVDGLQAGETGAVTGVADIVRGA